MSTRGAYGIKIDGCYKISYNHFDSYPAGLGVAIVEQWRRLIDEIGTEIASAARAVRLYPKDAIASDRAAAAARALLNSQLANDPTGSFQHDAAREALHRPTLRVSLRDLVRDIDDKMIFAFQAGAMTDGFDFMRDGLMCEWAYVIDIDTSALEIYRGFCRDPHLQGPFAKLQPLEPTGLGRAYYPVRQVARVPLGSLDDEWPDLITMAVAVNEDPSAPEHLEASAHDVVRAVAFLERHSFCPWTAESSAVCAPVTMR